MAAVQVTRRRVEKLAFWSLFDDFGHRFATIVVGRCFGPVRCPTDAVFDHQSHFGRRVSHFYSKSVIAEQKAADRLAADYRPDMPAPRGVGGSASSVPRGAGRWLLRLASMGHRLCRMQCLFVILTPARNHADVVLEEVGGSRREPGQR